MGDQNNESTPQTPEVDLAEFGARWLEDLFGTFGLDISVEGEQNRRGDLSYDIKGRDARHFVEGLGMPRGQMVDTIQTLLFPVLQRQGWEQGDVYVDAMSFRRQRGDNLTAVAVYLGDKVVELGKPITVLGMSSLDRKVIHKRLEDAKGVKSESEGFGPLRRLKIKRQ